MTRALVLFVVTGCGRIGFDPVVDGGRLDGSIGPGASRCPDGPPAEGAFATGFRGVVVTDALSEPSGVVVAGGPFGERLYVVNNGNMTVSAIDPATGAIEIFVPRTGWPTEPTRLTALVWDEAGVFDGDLYVADRGTNGDDDSVVYAVDASGRARRAANGPGPGLDDAYSLAFVDDADYGTGLMIAGDTDDGPVGVGRYTDVGFGAPFSTVSGVSGLDVDARGRYGGGLFASRPRNASFDGGNDVVRLGGDGSIIGTLADEVADVHAVAFAPAGPFQGWLHAATLNEIVAIDPAGNAFELVSSADFEEIDGNVLAFSADGALLYFVSRAAGTLVCVEATGEPIRLDAYTAPAPIGG